MKPIILVSTSPRRKELLDSIRIPYYCIEPLYEEDITSTKQKNICEYFARQKLNSVLQSIKLAYDDAEFVLSADTLIIHNKKILGKPKSIEQARSFLESLSGKTHRVHTSLAVYNRKTNTLISKTTTNKVKITSLKKDDIDWYLSTNEWVDAAGAYKIQGSFQRFVPSIEGTQASIMGLPLSTLCAILQSQGYDFS